MAPGREQSCQRARATPQPTEWRANPPAVDPRVRPSRSRSPHCRVPARTRPAPFAFNLVNKDVSGNIAGVDHAPGIDSDSDSNSDGNSSNDMDGPVPIDSNPSLATRHSVTSF